jgi:DNA mismatch endonuclease (patch repair protein)
MKKPLLPPTPARSALMKRIRSVNTTPELLVRSTLHRLGYRFRLHIDRLPGKPDIVLPKYRMVLFVHGCFWHQHPGCKYTHKPKTNLAYWEPKLSRNISRFALQSNTLEKLGWTVNVVWECQTKNPEQLAKVLMDFFTS